jgi:hypothetical protein
MKEILAQKNKKPYVAMLVLSLIALAITSLLFIYPVFYYFALFATPVLALSSLVWLVFIFDKRGAISHTGEEITLYIGLIKKVINLKDITEISLVPKSAKKETYYKGMLRIKISVDSKEKEITVNDIVDECGAIEKLKNLIVGN